MSFAEYTNYDALGLAELVKNKEVTSLELIDAALAAVDRVNAELNCVVTRIDERARTWAKESTPDGGSLAGVPFLLKDLAGHLAGMRNTSGSRYERDFVPKRDGELTARYRKAGLIPIGNTASSELGLLPVTESALHGPTENPWRRGHTAGGSSGGSGSAVAARIVPVAHGSDGGGSIRIPSACGGVFGLKPTRARTPQGPETTERWHGFTSAHALSLSVRDSAAFLDISHGPELGAPYEVAPPERPYLEEVGRDPGQLRIGFSARPHLPGDVHPDCRDAVEDVAKLCAELGHRVEEAHLDINPMEFGMNYFTVVASEVAAYYEMAAEHIGHPPRRGDLEPQTALTAMIGRRFSGADVCAAFQRLRQLSQRVASFFATYDVFLTPTLGMPPPKHYALRPSGLEAAAHRLVAAGGLSPLLSVPGVVEAAVQRVYKFLPFPPLANVTGQPAANIPLVWNDDGMPIGTMFTGRFGDEATLFRLAGQLESARPWRDRKPSVHA